MGLSPAFTADQPVARSRSSNTATGQGCCCCWWCGHAPANTPLLEPEASASGLAPSTEPCDGWWPSWETRGCSRSSQRGGCVRVCVAVGGAGLDAPGRGQAGRTGAPGGFGDLTRKLPETGLCWAAVCPRGRREPGAGSQVRGGGSWERDGCPGEQSLRHPPGRRPHHRGPAPSVGARRAVGDTGEPSVQCLARRHHSDPARQSPERGQETAARGGGVNASFPGALLPPGGQAREGGPGPPAPRTPRLPSCPHPAQDPRRPHVGFRDGGPPLLQAGSAQGPTAPVSGGGGRPPRLPRCPLPSAGEGSGSGWRLRGSRVLRVLARRWGLAGGVTGP